MYEYEFNTACFSGDTEARIFMNENYGTGFTYEQFAPMFTADKFDPNQWADLFLKSGAKLVHTL